ncbi:DNA binding [Coemansia sp. RSA 1199]|nr:DNA binding [Coemansia sp. RSA 1199]
MYMGNDDSALSATVSAQATQATNLLMNSTYAQYDTHALCVTPLVPYFNGISMVYPQLPHIIHEDTNKTHDIVLPPKLVTGHFAHENILLSPGLSGSSLSMSPDSDQVSLDTQFLCPPYAQTDTIPMSFVHASSQPTSDLANIPSSDGWTQHMCSELFGAAISSQNVTEWAGELSNVDFGTSGLVEQAVSRNAHTDMAYPESLPKPAAKDTRTRKTETPARKRRRTNTRPADACIKNEDGSRKRKTLSDTQKRRFYTWLINNIDNPYPNDDERMNELCGDGISKTNFKWWFSNHRHRSLQHCVGEDGRRTFKAKLPFYKACIRLGIDIPWEIPEDIQALLKPTHR